MIRIATLTKEDGRRELHAVDEIGGLAIAVEHQRATGLFWHLSVVAPPSDIRAPRLSFPEVETEQEARAWVQFLGELTERARQAPAVVRPVWCPNDHRQTLAEAAQHQGERGLRLVSGGDE